MPQQLTLLTGHDQITSHNRWDLEDTSSAGWDEMGRHNWGEAVPQLSQPHALNSITAQYQHLVLNLEAY